MVSRLHHDVRKRVNVNEWTAEQGDVYLDNRTGFLAYCQRIDAAKLATLHTDESTTQLLNDLMELPCWSDLMYYLRWHSLALQIMATLQIPVHVLYYEDYSRDYAGTVRSLYNFLNVSHVLDDALPFVSGKTYQDYYTDEQHERLADISQRLSSEASWTLLQQRYFYNDS